MNNMSTVKDDSLHPIGVQLNGKNYSYWRDVMKNLLLGESMWSYVTGEQVKPTDGTADDYDSLLQVWNTDNAKILTWIHNSVTYSIGIGLRKYETAREVWDHLARLYTQYSFVQHYQLEIDIRALYHNDMSVQELYSSMSELWDQLALIEVTESSKLSALPDYVAWRERQRLFQFLMALRPEFHGLRWNILHRTSLPSIDSAVREFLAEEIRLKSMGIGNKKITQSPSSSASTVPRLSKHCRYCKQYGHWKTQCPILLSKGKLQQQREPHQHSVCTYQSPQFSNGVVASGLDPYMFEQFRHFLASHPHAVSVFSHKGPGISEGDLD